MANRVVTVSGGNLFDVAARELGDATQAVRIAQRNGLTDFFLTGLVTLSIPMADADLTGGVPQQ
jgi:hypothetical protein